LGLVYVPFLKRLPKQTRNLFMAAGVIYVGGAVGCEMIGALIVERSGLWSPAFALEVLVEETLEMSGIALFIYAITSYIQSEFPGMSVRASFNPAPRPAADLPALNPAARTP
jgi:hypothetical protein